MGGSAAMSDASSSGGASGSQKSAKRMPEPDALKGEKGGPEAYDIPPDAPPYWAKQFIVFKDMGGEGGWKEYLPVAKKQYEAIKKERDRAKKVQKQGLTQTTDTKTETTTQGKVVTFDIPTDAD